MRSKIGEWIELFGMLLGLILIIAFVVVIVMVVGIWFLVLVGFILAAVFLAWLTGARITISRDGEKIGYVRWFTFHKKEENEIQGNNPR